MAQPLNSTFANWGSASVVNPKAGFQFCDGWFVASVARGRPIEIVLQPLNPKAASGLRLSMQNPPGQVRIWHMIPREAWEGQAKFVKLRLRGVAPATGALQLDSMALLVGDDANRKVDRKLVGAIALSDRWHEFTVELRGSRSEGGSARYLALRFSGKGTIEVEYCRLEPKPEKMRAWPVAKSMAAKILSGFPRRRTVPAASTPGNLTAEVEHEAPTAVRATRPAAPIFASARNPALLPAGDARAVSDPGEGHEPGAPSTGMNVLRNASFLDWGDNGPEHWKVSVPGGTSIRRAPATADDPLTTSGILLTTGRTPADRTITLGQRVAGAFKPAQILDVVIVGYADTRADATIGLIGCASGAVAATATTTLWPRWQFRTARITLPSDLDDEDFTVVLTIGSAQEGTVKLALVGVGAPADEIVGELEIQDLSTRELNAVVNGRLDYWSGPVRRTLTASRMEIADEWMLVGKGPNPAIEARLTELSPRGLRDGREYAPVLALAVHGEISGPHLRLEVSVDALQVLAGASRQLRFFARTSGTPDVEGEAPPAEETIQQIFVAERCRLAPEHREFSVTRLFTIKRNVRIRRTAELHTFELRPDHRALLVSKANEAIGDLGRSLLLVFEFARRVDVAIGDVGLGGDASSRAMETSSMDDVSMEDPNIATQLPLLKGVDHWRSLQVLAPAPPSLQAAPYGHAHWSWLPGSKLTVDIVICVYNAIEETLGCLASVVQHTTIPHTITIVNDKSDESTRDQLRQFVHGKPWIRLIENETSLGYTRSANIGLSSSAAEWVVLLDSETIVVPGWLEGMLEVTTLRPDVAMVGPLSNAASWQSVPELHDTKAGWSANPLPEGFAPADVGQLVGELSSREFPDATLLDGFCTLMRLDVVAQVGYLDEVAFPTEYGAENDLCLRVRKAGYSLAVADHVYVYHVESASFGRSRRSEPSRRGTAQLLAKHPDVDITAARRDMAELTSLIELRKKLRRALVRPASSPSSALVEPMSDMPERAPPPRLAASTRTEK